MRKNNSLAAASRTQFGRALEQVDITCIAYRRQSSQVKGRVERLCGAFQEPPHQRYSVARAAAFRIPPHPLRRCQGLDSIEIENEKMNGRSEPPAAQSSTST